MTTRAIVALTEPRRYAGVRYPAGYEFERLTISPATSLCRDGEGRHVRVLNRLLVVLKDADGPPEPPATLAMIVRRGLVRPALEVLAAG